VFHFVHANYVTTRQASGHADSNFRHVEQQRHHANVRCVAPHVHGTEAILQVLLLWIRSVEVGQQKTHVGLLEVRAAEVYV